MAMVRMSAVKSAVNDSGIGDPEKAALISAVADLAVPVPDTWVYRIVVIALGLAIFVPLAALVGDSTDKSASLQMLLPIATGALGALAGLLAPSPGGNS